MEENEKIEKKMILPKGLDSSVAKEKISLAKKISEWFEISITIKMFGVEIFKWKWPPTNQTSLF